MERYQKVFWSFLVGDWRVWSSSLQLIQHKPIQNQWTVLEFAVIYDFLCKFFGEISILKSLNQLFNCKPLSLFHQIINLPQLKQICLFGELEVEGPAFGEGRLFSELTIAYFLEILSECIKLWLTNQLSDAVNVNFLFCTILIHQQTMFCWGGWYWGCDALVCDSMTIHTLRHRRLITRHFCTLISSSIRWLKRRRLGNLWFFRGWFTFWSPCYLFGLFLQFRRRILLQLPQNEFVIFVFEIAGFEEAEDLLK